MPCMYLFMHSNSHVNMYIGMHDEDLMYCMRMISIYIYIHGCLGIYNYIVHIYIYTHREQSKQKKVRISHRPHSTHQVEVVPLPNPPGA